MALTPAVKERLKALALEYQLSSDVADLFGEMLEFMAAHRRAPTTVTDPKRAVDVHIADSLSVLKVVEFSEGQRVADIGAGAGFPGLVLAAACPDTHFALLESIGWKCDFMAELVAGLSAPLQGVEIVNLRAEQWEGGINTLDKVTARALAPLNVLLEYAAPLLVVGGQLLAWKGDLPSDERAAAANAAAKLGCEFLECSSVTPFEGSESHRIYRYVKRSETPPGFPRRAGMARKRPLGLK